MPVQMDWAEAWRLLLVLLSDPSTYVSAALAEWDHPISREDMTLRDLYDLQHRSKARRRPKPYSRPWLVDSKRHGRGAGVTIAQFKAIKARLMGK